MATQASIRTRLKDTLYSALPPARPFMHKISGTYSTGATTMNVDDGTNFAVGDVIEFEATGDQYFVQEVAANALTVIPDYNGTTSSTHFDDSRILKNPRFTLQQIDQ